MLEITKKSGNINGILSAEVISVSDQLGSRIDFHGPQYSNDGGGHLLKWYIFIIH